MTSQGPYREPAKADDEPPKEHFSQEDLENFRVSAVNLSKQFSEMAAQLAELWSHVANKTFAVRPACKTWHELAGASGENRHRNRVRPACKTWRELADEISKSSVDLSRLSARCSHLAAGDYPFEEE